MPLQATSGAASQDGFGGNGVPVIPNYIEEVFNTYLYTGTGATLTITNNIDMTKGYLLWFKTRSTTKDHKVYDSARGVDKTLVPNTTASQVTQTFPISVSTTGFTIPDEYDINTLNDTLVAWTFRKQPKFFDVVTYTGNGAYGRAVPHNLDAVPGFLIVKKASATGDWYCQHRQDWQNYYKLNAIDAASSYPTLWGDTQPTSTNFYVGVDANSNGATYVAYLFAHNAGGFGLTGTDNVVSCGSYTGNASLSGPVVTLGYEPQWVLVKRSDSTGNWQLQDNMRSLSYARTDILFPNLANAATTGAYPSVVPTATGFYIGDNGTGYNASGGTYIYIAIRRGPMKVPTSGTSVYTMALINSASANNTNFVTSGFPVDLWMTITQTSPFADPFLWMPRLTTFSLNSTETSAEGGNPYTNMRFDGNTGIVNRTGATGSTSLTPNWMFQRAPSFFDVVCYTGTGVARTVNHNLGVAPEMLIVKYRSSTGPWYVYVPSLGNTYLALNGTNAITSAPSFLWNSTAPTSSVFSLGDFFTVNEATGTYVAYLFATCAGVSKVGSYTGTGATQTINCDFTGGARFVMIKRTDSTGGWYVWDTTRGMVSGTDPSLRFNIAAAQVNADSVFTITTGFQIVSTAADINASGGTYIFLAIA